MVRTQIYIGPLQLYFMQSAITFILQRCQVPISTQMVTIGCEQNDSQKLHTSLTNCSTLPTLAVFFLIATEHIPIFLNNSGEFVLRGHVVLNCMYTEALGSRVHCDTLSPPELRQLTLAMKMHLPSVPHVWEHVFSLLLQLPSPAILLRFLNQSCR